MLWKRFRSEWDGKTFIENEEKNVAIVYTDIIDGTVYFRGTVVATLNMSLNVIGNEVHAFPGALCVTANDSLYGLGE